MGAGWLVARSLDTAVQEPGWCKGWWVSCRSGQPPQKRSAYRCVGGLLRGLELISSPPERGRKYALTFHPLDRLIQRPLDRTPSYAPGARYQVGGENSFVPVLSFDRGSLWPGGPRMPADDQVFYGTSGSSLSEGIGAAMIFSPAPARGIEPPFRFTQLL